MDSKLDEKSRRAFEEGLAHIRMAQTWKEQQDEERRERELKKAIKSLDKVVSRAPTFDEGWVQLALAYFGLRDYSLAKFLLEKALTHVSRSKSALKAKGMLLEKIGSYVEAARVYERLHRIDSGAGFDKKQQQALEQIIDHDQGHPRLPETEELLRQMESTTFAFNGIEAMDATITFTNERILCIGRKVPEHEERLRPKLLQRQRPPLKSGLLHKEELHVSIPLNTIESARKVRFYARNSLQIWDRNENHLALVDLPEPDIETLLSFLEEHKIETGEIEAKICTLLLVMFVGSLLLSVVLLL